MNHWLKRRKIKNTLINIGSIVKETRTGTLMVVATVFTLASVNGISTFYRCQWFVGSKLHDGIFSENEVSLETP